MTTPHQIPSLRLRHPTDLLAAVPWVLGFHPRDSLVLLAVGDRPGPHARCDLPPSDGPADLARLVAGIAPVLPAYAGGTAAIAVYGADHRLALAAVDAVEGRLERADVPLLGAVRAHAGRWHCLRGCDDQGCPPGGTSYDLSVHPTTARAVLAGDVVLGSRDELAATLRRRPGEPRDAQDAQAVREGVERRLDTFDPARSRLVEEGHWVRRRVRRAAGDRRPLDAADAARLLVALLAVEIRDVAWAEITRETAVDHVELWRRLLRRAPDELAAAPAALLGFAAWLRGDGALAWCAVDRCQEADPGYRMAALLTQALAGAVAPATWQPIPSEALTLFAE